jgi:hypothetical protein
MGSNPNPNINNTNKPCMRYGNPTAALSEDLSWIAAIVMLPPRIAMTILPPDGNSSGDYLVLLP